MSLTTKEILIIDSSNLLNSREKSFLKEIWKDPDDVMVPMYLIVPSIIFTSYLLGLIYDTELFLGVSKYLSILMILFWVPLNGFMCDDLQETLVIGDRFDWVEELKKKYFLRYVFGSTKRIGVIITVFALLIYMMWQQGSYFFSHIFTGSCVFVLVNERSLKKTLLTLLQKSCS